MEKEQLEFVVVNDSENDFELMQEVWLNNQQIADLRLVQGEWKVTFFPTDGLSEVSWSIFEKIYEAFQKFTLEGNFESF